jgi:hypothetical protein
MCKNTSTEDGYPDVSDDAGEPGKNGRGGSGELFLAIPADAGRWRKMAELFIGGLSRKPILMISQKAVIANECEKSCSLAHWSK